MGEVTVTQAVAADLAAVNELLEEVDELHREALPWLFRKVSEPRSSELFDEFLSKPDHALLVARTAAGDLAGALFLFLRSPSRVPIVQPGAIAEIDTLVVAAQFRRQGVGMRLVKEALQWATQKGATRTELGVYEFNEGARTFWQAAGFQTLSRRLVAHVNSASLSPRA